MKTLKKVNSILFTVMSVVVILLGIVFLIFTIQEFIPYNFESNQTETFTENLFEVDSTTYRKQRISISSPILIDSTSKKYLVPAEVVSLQNPEKLEGLFDIRAFDSSMYDYAFSGLANNYLIVDQETQKTYIIFDSKVFVSRFKILSKKKHILFEVISEDTNQDGFLDLDDNKSLWIYSILNEQLLPIKLNSLLAVDFNQNSFTKDVFITFAEDLNKNGSFESNREPTSIWKLNLKTYSLIQLIEDKDLIELQHILDQ